MDDINDQLQSIENKESNTNIDLFQNAGKMNETSSQYDTLQHTLQNDIDNSSNKFSENDSIEVNPPLNEPTLNRLPEQENTKIEYGSEDGKIKKYIERKISVPRVLFKKQIVRPLILNNSSRKRKKIPLNLENISVPKQDTLNVKLSSPSITSDQTKATTSIMTVSSAAVVKPETTTIPMVQSKSNITENSCSKIVSTQKPEIKLNDSTSNILVVPHNGVNYLIKNSVKPSIISNTRCNESAEQKKQFVVTNVTLGDTAKKVSKFVTRMKKQSDGTYKMLAPPGQVPACVENLFNPNSHFIKQKADSNLIENECKVSFVQIVNTEENSPFQKDSKVLSEETNCMKIVSGSSNNIENKSTFLSKDINNMVISSVNSITKETNLSENELQESSKKTKSIKTPSINCMLVEPKNVEEKIKGTNNYITEKPAHVDEELKVSSEKTSSMESSPINSISENTFNILDKSQVSSQETNCIEMTPVSISKETNHSENESEKTNSIITQSINVEPKNIKKEIQFAEWKAVIETSPSNYIIEETDDIEEEPEVSSEKTSCKETSSMDKSSDNLIPMEPKNIKKEVQLSERKAVIEASGVKEKSPSNYIIEETDNIEEEQEISSEETICMESSRKKTLSANSISVEPTDIKKTTQAAEETCEKISSRNSITEETNAIQKRTQVTSDQTNYLEIPSVNPNTVKSNHVEKESQMSLNNTSSNVTFKAPDITSFQKHKFIVSRTIANKKYAIKNITDTQNKIKLKAISNEELLKSPGLVHLLPNTRPIFQTNKRPIIISKFDPKVKLNPKFNTNGKQVFVKIIKQPDINNSTSVISIDEMKKMLPKVINTSKVIRVEKNKIPPSIEMVQEKKRIKFSDEVYKMINSKQVAPVNKSDVPIKENQHLKKPIIDRKMLLQTLKSRINKKKQLIEPSVGREKKTFNDNLNNLETPCSKLLENNTHLNAPHQTIPKHLEGSTILERQKQQQMQFKMKELQKRTSNYLNLKRFTPAPKKLFDKPFPTEKNFFKIGHKLEGIDPEHEALFCAMTIVETCGYRLKLHFDGYPAKYDFWVNVDCPDIFYTNWCKENNRTLQPPRGYEKEFNWDVYLHENGDCTPAPRANFVSTKNVCSDSSHSFKTGLKCEALDKMTRTITKQLICVATIADVLGDRIRIHFDGWNDDFDYWTDITSTNIHPIGWCDSNGRSLCPPNGYNDLKGKKPFKWCEYLKETNSEAVPESAFIRRPLREFNLNMAIEVVDLVVPSLIRVALIVDVRGDEIKILYDGFDSKYAYWIEDDSPDIHPIGWCLKTNHSLEIPPDELGACKVDGCNGKGSTNVLSPNHFSVKDCPYEFERWGKIVSRVQLMPDRLKSNDLDVEIKRKRPRRKKLNHFDGKQEAPQLDVILNKNAREQKKKIIQNKSNKIEIKKKNEWRKTTVKKKKMSIESIENFVKKIEEIERNAGRPVERNLYRSNLGLKGRKYSNYPILNMPKIPNGDARKWSVKEVGTFVDNVVKLNSNYRSPNDEVNYSSRFIKKAIKGEMFLNLHQDYFTKIMKIPLGSALKIFNGIVKLRREIPTLAFKNENWIFNQY